MNAITVWQPWASLLACGAKKYETRGWETSYRGPIAIHAAKKLFNAKSYLDRELHPFAAALGLPDIYSFDTLPYGCIIAVAELAECWKITDNGHTVGSDRAARIEGGKSGGKVDIIEGDEILFGDWTPGRYAWQFSNMAMLVKPIHAKGMQRLWKWEETSHLIAIDPWVIGSTKIWTPQGIRSGKRVEPGREDTVMGLEVA